MQARETKTMIRGLVWLGIICVLTIAVLVSLFFLGSITAWREWHMAISLLGFAGTMSVMVWSMVAQMRKQGDGDK